MPKRKLVPLSLALQTVDPNNYNAALSVAIRAARAGRGVLLKYLGRLKHVEEKFQAGLVSEADKESEKAIFDYLKKFFPSDQYLGEEQSAETDLDLSTVVRTKQGQQIRRWIIDPLDGTTNYIHQFPIFCISIGLEVDGKMQVAVVDVPILGEVFTAIRGQGAFVNGEKLQVSSTKTLREALLATGFFGEDENLLNEQLKIFSRLVRVSRGIRRPGAAAYDLCLVAKGVFDGYWERGLKPWDSAAGILLVREAGGVVTTYRNDKYHPFKKTIVAGNPHVQKELQAELLPNINSESD